MKVHVISTNASAEYVLHPWSNFRLLMYSSMIIA